MNRRLFLRGLVAAPAVVAIGSLMPIRGIIMPIDWGYREFGLGYAIARDLLPGVFDNLLQLTTAQHVSYLDQRLPL